MSSNENEPSLFDRFADGVGNHTSKAWFFALCVVIVLLWVPTLFLLNVNSSQLIINTTTTIVTFLLVALLQNTSSRQDSASQAKLNAIAEYLCSDGREQACSDLRKVIGQEKRESS